MITHRALRDLHRCREKYGDAWLEYERQVPYLFIPVSLALPLENSRLTSTAVRLLGVPCNYVFLLPCINTAMIVSFACTY
jgi:hypothetical protein